MCSYTILWQYKNNRLDEYEEKRSVLMWQDIQDIQLSEKKKQVSEQNV